ncbi:MAG: hypothetical protein AABY90_03840, partial [Nitrospirota bacterium]
LRLGITAGQSAPAEAANGATVPTTSATTINAQTKNLFSLLTTALPPRIMQARMMIIFPL